MRGPLLENSAVTVLVAFLAGLTSVAILFLIWKHQTRQGPQNGANGVTTSVDSPPAGPDRGAILYSGEECPICLSADVDTPVQTNCGHWYCGRCILEYYGGEGTTRIKCPVCRQEVNMLHGPGTSAKGDGTNRPAPTDEPTAADGSASTDGSVTPETRAVKGAAKNKVQEEIARFNERSSGRRRTLRQVIGDAPLLLRRLWCDLRRGDTRMFAALIRGGFMVQLFVVVLYIISPVDFLPESLMGMWGLIDDALMGLVFLLHVTVIYRAILLSWERARIARAARPAGEGGREGGSAFWRGVMGAAAAAAAAMAVGTMIDWIAS